MLLENKTDTVLFVRYCKDYLLIYVEYHIISLKISHYDQSSLLLSKDMT